MSAAKAKDVSKKTFQLTGPWAGAWRVFAAIGVVGLLASGFGYTQDPRRFAFSWMFAFQTCLAIALGAMFFVLVQRLTSAGWSVTVRRTAEFFTYGILVLVPLFIPVVMTMGHLFPWLGEHHAAEEHASLSLVTPAYAQTPAPQTGTPTVGQVKDEPAGEVPNENPRPTADEAHGPATGVLPGTARNVPSDMPEPAAAHAHAPGAAEAGHGPGGDPHALIERSVMAKKSGYLNRTFFFARMIVYFLVWCVIATRMFAWSVGEDEKRNPSLTVAAQRSAPVMTVLYAMTLTFAAFDWIMSLEPTWFSTIFGVVIFACGVVSSLAVLVLTTLALQSSGPLAGAVTVEHFHDLGKLLFGFLVFWAYVSFAQFFLIWYAALPEETTFFHNRWDYAPWDRVSMAIILFHFVVPFFWLMSRWFKRNLGRLQIGAAILLVMHVVDMYWFVMPNYHLGKEGFTFHWLDITCLAAVAGIYGAFVFHKMTRHALVPTGDPRLQRALHFQNV